MLQVPRLDGDDYESIFQRARSRIPALTSEWTNFNAADPGITTLQTFAWLFDTLHYYMNASGEVHKLKYLKLLGIRPNSAPPRACWRSRARARSTCPRARASGRTTLSLIHI